VTEDERVRLFVALELPEPVVSGLVDWRSGVAGIDDLRPVSADALHVTLCFLGSRSVSSVDAIATACGVVQGSGPARVSLADAAWLPPRRPRVLAVRLEDRSGRLAEAQAALSGQLEAGGWYVPERRPFLAHVTVARVRGRPSGRRPGAVLPAPPQFDFEASQVTLFRSRLSPAGARYERLESVWL
jgi:2'-5' RNA ligase